MRPSSRAVRAGRSCPVTGRCLFCLLLSLFGGACECEVCRKSLLVLGGRQLGSWCFVWPRVPPPPPSFGKPACKQVEAWSLNVSDSEPEVGSASAGQTSFAGWRSRGRGSNGGGTSETPGCWERQGEGGGRGPRVGSREPGEGSALPRRGLGGCRSSPRAPAAASTPLRLQLRLIAAEAPCAPCAGHQREPCPQAFPILLPSSRNQSPPGSPFLTCFPE